MGLEHLKRKTFRHVEPPFPIDNLKSYNHKVGRLYVTPDGYAYPSVTTVVNHGKDEIFKEWRERVGEAEANRIADQGTEVHDIIEMYLRNHRPDLRGRGTISRLFMTLRPKLKGIDDIYALEAPLYSDKLMIAGRVDCIAKYKGEISIIDFKTTQRVKKYEWLDSYFMQATAYALMWEKLQKMSIKQCVILMVGEDDSLTEYIENPKDWIKPLYEKVREFHLTHEDELI